MASCSFSHVLLTLAIIAGLGAIAVYFLMPSPLSAPVFVNDNWFGEGDKRQEDTSIKTFEISVSNEILDDLKKRLQNTRYIEPLEGIQWEYGTNQHYMRDLVNYWINKYDWKAQEKLLNSVQNYKTTIDGLEVHFWHLKPQINDGQKLIPIMFIHGWPGSFFEFYEVILLLIEESKTGQYAYEIICPSIPGYGFSEASHKPGLNAVTTATIFIKLMDRLGHTQYYVQGGDWGSFVTRSMALIDKSHKRHIRGIHLNMFPINAPYGPLSYLAAYFTFPPHEHKKIFPLKDFFYETLRESGYLHIQATKPDTLGLGLNDSPAGLASYIVEKFFICAGCQLNESSSCLEPHFTKDEMLTNFMIYWITNSITSSMRFYKEGFLREEVLNVMSLPIDVPTGLAEFPKEVNIPPRAWLSSTFTNTVHYSVLPKGGHFAALEVPELFVKDVVEFVNKVEGLEKSGNA